VAGLPDEYFNKSRTVVKKTPEKGQTDYSKARKKAELYGIAIPLTQKTSQFQEYH